MKERFDKIEKNIPLMVALAIIITVALSPLGYRLYEIFQKPQDVPAPTIDYGEFKSPDKLEQHEGVYKGDDEEVEVIPLGDINLDGWAQEPLGEGVIATKGSTSIYVGKRHAIKVTGPDSFRVSVISSFIEKEMKE